MDRLLHLNRTLDELDPPRWVPPAADATHLVRTVHELRRVPLGELGAADLRTLLSQAVVTGMAQQNPRWLASIWRGFVM
ncbi:MULTISPECIES: contact-dependent growth inhibition system immunity protein [Streptomyces]|uniref:contact-dependent growth inhibition system immunity protein n=1 Tax=Streptomyces TaxID=1883 RepID=UPI0020C5BCBD|nr:contact-dependent growth inhibition system immunity protein [Streptomyces sp. GbtcB7]